MGGRVEITEEVYGKMVESFRTQPGCVAAATRASGADWRTVKKAWEIGWPNKPGRERPLREVIAEEQVYARARVKELEEQVARQVADANAQSRINAEAKARQDATGGRVQEAQMIRIARTCTMGLFTGIVSLTKAVPKLSVRVQQGMEALSQSTAPMKASEMVDMTRLTNNLINSLRTLSEVGQRVMEMDRLLLGEPTSILAVQHSELTFDEAARRIEAGRRALEYARQEGLTIDVTPVQRALPPVPSINADPGELVHPSEPPGPP